MAVRKKKLKTANAKLSRLDDSDQLSKCLPPQHGGVNSVPGKPSEAEKTGPKFEAYAETIIESRPDGSKPPVRNLGRTM
ncbi:uncharacterized protein PAC_11112 [Phialocephala subalpina]|uniref:Uncharacterized protein n=1 Tax=Phialocephala subalpina TaxID=576137 RepID=A0A1L7X878_9HELO|nr:uncharacterized protein PAC_11112 [Phialocephala subalpina]